MPITLAMYDKGYAHIGERLRALGLDLDVMTFDKSGRYQVRGGARAPGEVDVDYVWLNGSIGQDGFLEGAFETVLATRSIKVLQTFNAGLDHPFYKRLSQKGTRICNSSAQGIAIAEYVIAQTLALFHPIEQQRRMQAEKQWRTTPYREISGTRWAIVGFGPIGQEVAKRLKAFGAHVTVARRSAHSSPLADAVVPVAELPRVLPESDVVLLACPLSAETRGMAGDAFFAALKKGAVLINIARGGLIDEGALLRALAGDRLATAILDVFEPEPLPASSPLWSHPKVRVTPHTSFAGSGLRGRMDALFLENIQRFAKGAPLANEFDPRNFP